VAHSLRSRLLAWVVLPLAGAVAVDGWISHHNAIATATVVQDRLLLGSARMVAEQLRFDDGAVQEHIPPAALELFQSGDLDHVYYRVTTSGGQTVTGYSELALADVNLQPETAQFFDSVVRQQAVRAVAYLQPVLTDTGILPVQVEIAQTLQGHAQLTRSLWLQAMVQQLVILALVALLVLFGLRNCLHPLLRLRDGVLARRPGALHPLEIDAIPAELAPLVSAINEYARRLDQHTGVQQVFIQNAAHQLRTPLTLLNTQVSYAVRATDFAGRSESLAAIRQTVQQAVRLVNQLLTLSAAEAHSPAEMTESSVELDAVMRQVLEDLAGQAQAKGIDLGFEMAGTDPIVAGHPVALREIAMNLVDNAIRYTQPGGIVTSRIAVSSAFVTLIVEDNGPGIPLDERERVFERFYRIHDVDSGGCGLGLPIVREFASRIGAIVALRAPAAGPGLAAEVTLVRAHAGRNKAVVDLLASKGGAA
jgi:two-component system sensor histidine kinase TctE